MSNRSWYCAYQGQQQGPYTDAQFRDLITSGMVRADMLVWTDGMASWQKAGDIPGLFRGGGPQPWRAACRWRTDGSRRRRAFG